MEMFNGMFGKIQPGLCRISMSGGIAVKTSDGGYKSYDMKKQRLTNCSNFVFNIGEEFFFVIPTNKVEPGDIILVHGKPKCVIAVDEKATTIQVINYDDSTIDNILPERHVFMGSTYFYGKIVSMFGDNLGNGKGKTKKIMQYMMMSEMMKSMTGSDSGYGSKQSGSAMNAMLVMSMMNGTSAFGNMFGGLFDDDDDSAPSLPFLGDDEADEVTPEEEDA